MSLALHRGSLVHGRVLSLLKKKSLQSRTEFNHLLARKRTKSFSGTDKQTLLYADHRRLYGMTDREEMNATENHE